MGLTLLRSTAIGKIESPYVPGPLASALLASSPLLVFLVLTPARIYVGSQADLDYAHLVIFHLSLVHAVVVLTIYLVFQALPWLRKPIAYPLAVIGAFLLTVYLFAVSPTNAQLHAGIHFVKVSPDWALFEVGVLFALWGVVRWNRASRLVEVASMLCVVLWVVALVVVAFEAARADEDLAEWSNAVVDGPAEIVDSPNIYHIIFDGFEGMWLERIITDLELEPALAGFVWYSNAVSDYHTTLRSFPSFMNGRVFDKATLDQSGGELTRTGGLVQALAVHGYKVTQYNAYYLNNHVLAHERHSTLKIETEAYGYLRHLVQLLDLSALLSAPQVLKGHAAIEGRGLVSHWFLRSRHDDADWTRNPPLLSVKLLDQLLEDEPRRPASGQYVNAHLLLPHAPESLTARCGYAPLMTRTLVNLAEQTICTVAKIGQIADTLRELGRFQNAMIVIHSDHGTLRRARPLLLVKYPGAKFEPLQIADHEVRLVDIVPTILDTFEIGHAELDGVHLQDHKIR